TTTWRSSDSTSTRRSSAAIPSEAAPPRMVSPLDDRGHPALGGVERLLRTHLPIDGVVELPLQDLPDLLVVRRHHLRRRVLELVAGDEILGVLLHVRLHLRTVVRRDPGGHVPRGDAPPGGVLCRGQPLDEAPRRVLPLLGNLPRDCQVAPADFH